jgi:hypothetical protein
MPRVVKESVLALTVSGLMFPGALAVATVFLFLTGPDVKGKGRHWDTVLNHTPARVCLFGTLIGVAFCVLLAILACRRFTRADSACPGPYNQLRQGFDDLKERLAVASDDAVCGDALEHKAYLESLFGQGRSVGLTWLLGTGYVDAWRRLHAIEQALVFSEPAPCVVRDALADELRLDGSNIPQSKELLKRVRTGVANLDSTAERYLIEAPSTPHESSEEAKTAARAVLAQVRAAINEFQDGRREAMIRARNRLFGTFLFAGITGCVLLYVAILSGASKRSIVAASAFYLVGGLVGLVKQLQSAGAAGGTASQDDYGLGVVRLIQTPLFSGLAAVGGVVLVRLTQGEGAAAISLSKTYDLGKNPYGLVAAAFFGLTPALLLAGLQQRIDEYRTDLSKSGAAESQAS